MATKHTHGPNFGRKVKNCPRCKELEDGADPVTWNGGRSRFGPTPQQLQNHNCRASNCGPVCTYGDW